jgi:hypothetical protein
MREIKSLNRIIQFFTTDVLTEQHRNTNSTGNRNSTGTQTKILPIINHIQKHTQKR